MLFIITGTNVWIQFLYNLYLFVFIGISSLSVLIMSQMNKCIMFKVYLYTGYIIPKVHIKYV